MINKPFRITIEHWDEKVTIEKSHSDIDVEEFGKMLYQVSAAAGWSKELLDEIFK